MPPSKSKRKSKVKRLKSQDGTLISDDKTMLTRKVSLTNLGESSSKSVRDLANNFESQQKPTNETELMEEETTGESSSDEEVFSDDEEDEAESEQNEVSMKEMMRQMSGYMRKSSKKQNNILKSLKGMKEKIEKTNTKIDSNQTEMIDEMKKIGTRIDKLEQQVDLDRKTAKDNLEKFISENKVAQENKEKETDDKINSVKSKIEDLENLIKNMKDDERPMLPEIILNKPSYSNTVSNLAAPQASHSNNPPQNAPAQREKQKPKYASAIHEATAQFSEYSKRLAIRIDIEDFKNLSNQDISKIAPSVLFRDPSWENLRFQVLTRKISQNTHIPENQIRITSLNISSVNFDIAWIRFESEFTVRNIYKNSARIQSNQLHMFPVIPPCAIERKKQLESILKKLQAINPRFRYQIRLGANDFRIFVKEFVKGEYSPYREVPLEIIDPHEDSPTIKTDTTTVLPEELPSSEESLRIMDKGENTEWKSLNDAQRRDLFRLKLKDKNTRVTPLQIAEFLGEFLTGTRTLHHQAFLAKCPGTLFLGDFSGDMDQ